MKYIHYGSRFDFSKWKPIQNLDEKPSGGFWLSPENAGYGWEDFCDEDFPHAIEKQCFLLADDARVLHIHSVSQLRYLPFADSGVKSFSNRPYLYLDYEALGRIYDAVELHYSELDWGTSAEDIYLGNALNYWDCDSIVVMNPMILIPLSGE